MIKFKFMEDSVCAMMIDDVVIDQIIYTYIEEANIWMEEKRAELKVLLSSAFGKPTDLRQVILVAKGRVHRAHIETLIEAEIKRLKTKPRWLPAITIKWRNKKWQMNSN